MTIRHYLQRTRGLPGDDTAQALVEYVIAIPVVLLMFFAAVQTGVFAQTSQLTTYAAFAGARSYATSYSLFAEETGSAEDAHNQAVDRAKRAATLIMAPVSHAQSGEALMIWNPIRNVVSGLPSIVQDVAALTEGYVVASLYRMREFDVTDVAQQGGADSPTASIRCSFTYLIPVNLPGLVEVWDYLDRERHGAAHRNTERMVDYFHGDLLPIAGAEINDAVAGAIDFLEGLEQWVPGISSIRVTLEDALLDISSLGVLGSPYNIRVAAQARVGFEPWSGTPIVGPDDAECEAQPDPEREACLAAYREAQEEVNALREEMEAICDLVPPARQDEQEKLNAYNACEEDPDANCTAELNAYQSARTERINREEDCEEKTDEYEEKREELENSDAQTDCS